MWDSGMTDEYMTAVTEFNLTWDELIQCGRNSLKWSFAEPALKQRMLEDYERSVKAFEQKWSTGEVKDLLTQVHPVAYGYAARRWGIRY
jgi:adenosine deaminase CECR1